MFRISVLLILLTVVSSFVPTAQAQAQDGRRSNDWCNTVTGNELWGEARTTESTLRLGRGALTNINALNAFLYDIKDLCERYTAELNRRNAI